MNKPGHKESLTRKEWCDGFPKGNRIAAAQYISDNPFPIHEFDHLNKEAPLETWVSEFLNRNTGFIQDFGILEKDIDRFREASIRIFQSAFEPGIIQEDMISRLQESRKQTVPDKINSFYQKYRIKSCHRDPDRGRIIITLPIPIKALAIVDQGDKEGYQKIANYHGERLSNETSSGKIPRESYYVGVASMPDDIHRWVQDNVITKYDQTSYSGNRMLFVVNVDEDTNFLLKAMRKAMNVHKSQREKRKSRATWKSYLIVYDLHEAGCDNLQMMNVLQGMRPNYVPSSVNTLTDHYKEGHHLVHLGYTDYL